MQLFFILCNIIAVSPVGSLSTKVAPVQKVLQMMNDMLVKSKKAKSEEREAFLEYKQFCESTSAEKHQAVMDGKFQIAQLNAVISKATVDVSALASEIELLTNNIGELSSQSAMNQQYRALEHADFIANHEYYTSAIDTVDQALPLLTSSPGQGFAQVKDSLVALTSLNLPSEARQAVMAVIDSNHDPIEGLLERVAGMVEGLGKQFKEEKYNLEKDEAQQKHASNIVEQDVRASIGKSTEEQLDKMAAKAQREKAKIEAQGRLFDTTASVTADTQNLAILNQSWSVRSLEHEENQSVHALEIKALRQVIDIMSGGAITRGSKHLPTLARKGTSQSRSAGQSSTQKQVAAVLSDHARKVKSQVLSFVAVRVAEDPLQKVKKMIQEIVLKLMEEAFEEVEHEGFCDPDIIQIGTSKNTRDAKAEVLNVSTAKFGSEAADLSDQISGLDNEIALATNFRSEEKAHNAAILADAKAASMATEQAEQILNVFYGVDHGSAAISLVGLLEAIELDFIQLQMETKEAEDRAEADYTAFKRNPSQAKAVKSTATSYWKILEDSDVENRTSYQEHVMRREEEIELLRDALKRL